MRYKEDFLISQYSYYVAKYVREGHVQTDLHWTKNWKPNKIIKGE